MKTQSKLLFITVSLLFFTLNNHAQEFKWAKRAGLWAYDYGYGICADGLGNVYVAGKYEMDAQFDEIILSCEGNHDIFVAKYDSNGKIIWVNTAGGLYGDYAHAITCDEEGNTYVTGEIEATAIFHGSNIVLNAWGKNDIFVAKYSPEGVPLWAQRGGGPISDKGQSIAISKDAVYTTGYFRDTALFNNNGAFKAISAGKKDAFIAKYDLMGNLLWLKRGGGVDDDEGSGITVDADGFVYVAGHIDGDVNFDGVAVTSNGRDAYLAKYDPYGELLWIKNVGGSRSETAFAVKAAKDGRVYVTGAFSSKTDLGSVSLNSNGGRDIFVSCFTNDGEIVWAKSAGGNLDDSGLGISSDDDSNVYITGFYGESANFDGEVIIGNDTTEIFVAKYNSNGEFKWVMKADGQKDIKNEDQFEEAGRSIWVDTKKFVLITGSYRTDASFGPYNIQGWSNTDIFTAKIKQAESDESGYGTGISENNIEKDFNIYPIPANGEINITYLGKEAQDVNIKLESLEGKTLVKKQYRSSGSGTEVISLDNIAKGIYFLHIYTEQKQTVKKIVIK